MPRPTRLVVIVVALGLVVVTPVAWYLGSPVFLRTELNEPPIAAAPESALVPPAAATSLPSVTPSARPDAPSPPAPASASPGPGWTPAPARTGRFEGTDEFHFGRGQAILREVEPGRWAVRLEDFSVRNGPDLYVYLSPDPAGWSRNAIEVGRLRATDGSFNMRVAEGTDLSGVRSVLIWCKQFTHLFAFATLEG